MTKTPSPQKKNGDPPYGEERSVRILLECIPVYQGFLMHGLLHFKYIFRYTYQATISVSITMMLSTTPPKYYVAYVDIMLLFWHSQS